MCILTPKPMANPMYVDEQLRIRDIEESRTQVFKVKYKYWWVQKGLAYNFR